MSCRWQCKGEVGIHRTRSSAFHWVSFASHIFPLASSISPKPCLRRMPAVHEGLHLEKVGVELDKRNMQFISTYQL